MRARSVEKRLLVARGHVLRLYLVLIPLAGYQTYRVADGRWTRTSDLLLPWLAPIPWERPFSGCFGQPIGTPTEKVLEFGTRTYEGVLLFSVVFSVLSLAGAAITLRALSVGRRRDVLLPTLTLCTAIACVSGYDAFLAIAFQRFVPIAERDEQLEREWPEYRLRHDALKPGPTGTTAEPH